MRWQRSSQLNWRVEPSNHVVLQIVVTNIMRCQAITAWVLCGVGGGQPEVFKE